MSLKEIRHDITDLNSFIIAKRNRNEIRNFEQLEKQTWLKIFEEIHDTSDLITLGEYGHKSIDILDNEILACNIIYKICWVAFGQNALQKLIKEFTQGYKKEVQEMEITKTKRNYKLTNIEITDTAILSEINNVIAILEENTDKIDGVPKFGFDIEIIQANDNYMVKDIATNKFYLLKTEERTTEVYPLKTFGGFKMYTLEELKEMSTIDFLEYDEQTQAYIKCIIERTNILGKVKGLM